ncbi:hypothetical protein WR25_27294 [Diploscapter pachys]|uniref:ATP-dependent RNA helicase n=1 Tax=Diploscapter pachys TaxID=2018661 RepID=A0A2A2K606_9BILA|nr:hypothetical protein WR25_27294 [Diploscapter pachys]
MSGNIYTDKNSFLAKEQSNQQCYGDIESVKAIQAGKSIATQIAMKLEDLNILEELKRNLVKGVDLYQGLERVQQVAIPTFLAYGHDQVVISPTGSGKTLAYVLPILDNLIRDVSIGEENHRVNATTKQKIYYPRAIIIVPTREIAIQVKDVFETLSSGFDSIHFLLAVGGLKTNYSDIDDKTNLIMIGTVGRIIQELGNPKSELGRSRISLKMTRFIVLDEADRLVQKGFRSFYDDIEYIYKECDLLNTCYSLMFSATFPPNAQYLAKDFLFEDHIKIEIAPPGSANKIITQEFIGCDPAIEMFDPFNGKLSHYAVPEENLRKLVRILNAELANSDDCRILIFVKDPELAGRKISQYLEESTISHVMLAGFYQTITDKNGKEQEISAPQEERNEQLRLFTEGEVRVKSNISHNLSCFI